MNPYLWQRAKVRMNDHVATLWVRTGPPIEAISKPHAHLGILGGGKPKPRYKTNFRCGTQFLCVEASTCELLPQFAKAPRIRTCEESQSIWRKEKDD